MSKYLFAILLFISSFAIVAHGILVYQFATVESLIFEEDASDEKSSSKEEKDISKDKIGFGLLTLKQALGKSLHKKALDKSYTFSKGFYDTPYNPPDTI